MLPLINLKVDSYKKQMTGLFLNLYKKWRFLKFAWLKTVRFSRDKHQAQQEQSRQKSTIIVAESRCKAYQN